MKTNTFYLTEFERFSQANLQQHFQHSEPGIEIGSYLVILPHLPKLVALQREIDEQHATGQPFVSGDLYPVLDSWSL
jgi:hypothetical protein